MKNLRIEVTDKDTNQRLQTTRVPLPFLRIVARLLPAWAYDRMKLELEGKAAQELTRAVSSILDEVSRKGDDEIPDGVILDMEIYNDEADRTERMLVYVK